MAPITVTRDGDQVRITVGDEVVANGPDVPRLVEAAHALGASDPLKLRAGTGDRLARRTRALTGSSSTMSGRSGAPANFRLLAVDVV
jgi:hypothetical protein